jgi:hypothetical protein
VPLPARNVAGLMRQYGDPYYVKIDLEHYDQVLLEDLFRNGIRPAYISAESHDVTVLALLVAVGRYTAFKLVDGPTVAQRYKDHTIHTTLGPERYSFPHHSAGPFGDDISGPWLTANNFFRLLAFQGLGWKDVHASHVATPDPNYAPAIQVHLSCSF